MSRIGWFFTVLLLASPALAQSAPPALGAPGCGPSAETFNVTTDDKVHAVPAPEPGKALLVFIQDDARFVSMPRPTTRFGVDGSWVGATHKFSYFYISVDPGEHHLCASWQDHVVVGPVRSTAALHFMAESGGAYFFRAKDSWSRDRGIASVDLEPVDSDEAQVLLSNFSFSSSHPKK
jgi:hypothetical protein